MDDIKLFEAWQITADDLKLSVSFPWKQNEYELGILIRDFGSKKGTIVTGLNTNLDFKKVEKEGYYYSQLGQGYEKYEKSLYIDTLNDWGYFGDNENRPDWYNGKPWTE